MTGREVLAALWRRPLPAARWHRAATLLLFFAGAGLCLAFTQSFSAWFVPLLGAAVVTAAYALAALQTDRPWLRGLGGVAQIAIFALYGFWSYLGVSFGVLLGWTTRPWEIAAICALLVAALATARASWRRARVPLCLPLGVWICATLTGWLREEAYLRCDDYLAVTRQSGVAVVMGTATEEAACRPGDVLEVMRYPRKTWESPSGDRYVFTTQKGSPRIPVDAPAPGRLPGSVCEIRAGGAGEPRCVGVGKAHGIVDAPELDRLFVMSWGLRFGAGLDGVVYELTRSAPLEVVRELRVPSAGDGYYEPSADLLGTFNDLGREMLPLRASTLTALPPAIAPILPGEVRYDPARHQGVLCFAAGPLRTIDGGAFLAVAFDGDPFAFRPLGRSSSYPSAWMSLSWGCDWDPAARRVYAALPNLGLLVTLDYDSGQVLARHFVGFGMRSVAYDPKRRRVYLTNFLHGDVVAVDADSGERLASWFAGRFVREVRLTRDGSALLVTSNVGLLRISLDGGHQSP